MEAQTICVKCGKTIKLSAGYYNTPRGAFCRECYDKEPKEEKDRDLQRALKSRANIGRIWRNILG